MIDINRTIGSYDAISAVPSIGDAQGMIFQSYSAGTITTSSGCSYAPSDMASTSYTDTSTTVRGEIWQI